MSRLEASSEVIRDFSELTSVTFVVDEDLSVEISDSRVERAFSSQSQHRLGISSHRKQITRIMQFPSQVLNFRMALVNGALQQLDF